MKRPLRRQEKQQIHRLMQLEASNVQAAYQPAQATRPSKVRKRSLALLAAILILLSAFVACTPPVREFVVTKYREFISYFSKGGEAAALPGIHVEIPKGYTQIAESLSENERYCIQVFQNAAGSYLTLTYDANADKLKGQDVEQGEIIEGYCTGW